MTYFALQPPYPNDRYLLIDIDIGMGPVTTGQCVVALKQDVSVSNL